jgi:hypothetical protein
MRIPAVCLLVLPLLLGACSDDGGRDVGPSAAPDTPQAGSDAPDPSGYAVVGEDVYPPLLHRAEAVPCADSVSDSDFLACATDRDCGDGFACECAGFDHGFASRCIPAECRSDADCGGGHCLLSMGSRPDDCCSFGQVGLFCERPGSTCHDGGDCPGNGIACMYAPATDRFECQLLSCSCE